MKSRPLHRGHFAFLRAVLQGADPELSWSTCLPLESETAAARLVREVADWIRATCAATARCDGRYHVARLLRLDLLGSSGTEQAAGIDSGASLPLLEEGLRPHAPPCADARTHKRLRLVRRQLEALVGLEAQMLATMSAEDAVRKWFPTHTARLLEAAGLPDLSSLATRINTGGVRWWNDIPAVAGGKATRIVDWVHAHALDIGIRITPLRGRAHNQTAPLHHEGPSTALVPLEHFLVPFELDGHDGVFRTRSGECLLKADNDRQAIEAWLGSTQHASGTSNTFRVYRKDAERLLLWCVLVRRKAVSSLTVSDAEAYKDFLVHPPPHWCGHRAKRRDSPGWRPMEKGLSPDTLAQALSSLGSLFSYLVTHRYIFSHPFIQPRSFDAVRSDSRLQRTLTFEQWDRIDRDLTADLAAGAAHEPTRRRARAIRWLYATGLTASEMVAVQCGALRSIRFLRSDGTTNTGWIVRVAGRSQHMRDVPVPATLIAELGDELARFGRPRAATAQINARVPVVGRFCPADVGVPPPWTAGALYKSIRSFMQACASRMNGQDAEQVRQATVGWLRNTHGAHAVQGRSDGESKAVPAHHVAASMGYCSTTLVSQHLTSTALQRHDAMKVFWPPQDAP